MTASHAHRLAAIVSMGDELTLGQSLDTNARWLAERLVAVGIVPVEHLTLPDEALAIEGALRRLAGEVDVILCTGGLGPTADDLMREAIARACGDVLVEDPELLAQVRAWFGSRGRPMPAINAVQGLRPSKGIGIPNAHGTAPGIASFIPSSRPGHAGADCYCMPGPPREMMPMFESSVAPRLAPPAGRVVLTRALHTMGLGESEIATRLGDLMRRDARVLVGTTASWGVVSIRVRYEGSESLAQARARIAEVQARVRGLIGPHILFEDEATPASAAIAALRKTHQTLAVVESCTGGLLGAMITEVAGSSDVFCGGWITYSNRLKHAQVGVGLDLLAEHGAVSAEVAGAMAGGGLDRSGADYCLSITGIAGPGGGSEQKPVGTVYIALAQRTGGADIRRFWMSGDRESVRCWSARSALGMLCLALAGRPQIPLLRQSTPG